MPTYKNRIPLDQSTPVWHYTTQSAVVAMLRDRKLRLTRLDAFPDPFEGSVPKQMFDDQVALFSSVYDVMMEDLSTPDPWTVMTQRRLAMRRSAHAICWSWGDESEALWKLYCRDDVEGQGLALRSQLGKLEGSVEDPDVYVSPVSYRHYHIGPSFDNELDPFMHKRKGFECEREVRLLLFDTAHFNALNMAQNLAGPYPPELSQYRFLDWSPPSAIDAITVSPYASEAYESRARDEIAAIDPKVAVELSVLSERLYKVNF